MNRQHEVLREQINERRRVEEELRTSSKISTIPISSLDIHSVFHRFAGEVKNLVPFDATSIMLVTEDGANLRVAYQSADWVMPYHEGDQIPLEESATQWVLSNRRTRVVDDLASFQHLASDERNFQAGYRSAVWVPLLANDRGIGSFVLRSRRPRAFGPREQAILEHLATQLGPVVENARLYGRLEASHEEIKRQQAELHQAQRFNQWLIDSMPAAMLVVKPDLEVVFANVAFFRALGLRKRRIEGRRLQDILRLDGLKPLISATAKSRKSFAEREVIYRHPKRGRRWFRVSASRLPAQEPKQPIDNDTQLLLYLDDITEWRQTQEKIQETSQLISLGEIIAGVAHELNNPLTSVMGFAQLVMEQNPQGANRADLELIFSEAQRAAKVVRNLLSFVRKHKAEKSWVDLASTMERVLALKSYDLRASNIEVDTAFPADLDGVYADEHQLEQVFLNIVTNAQQVMSGADRPGHLLIRGRRENGVVQLSFQDNGPGIPASSLKTVFEPFFTTKGAGQGTGLGLSICKSLVQEQ